LNKIKRNTKHFTMDQEYNKCHMCLLQIMMDRQILSHKELRATIKKICDSKNMEFTDSKIKAFVKTICHKVEPFNLLLKKCQREETGETMYVLISKYMSDINKLVIGSNLQKNEVEYLERLIDLIVNSNDPDNLGRVSSVEALNMAGDCVHNISKQQAQVLLNHLQREKYLNIKRGMISMTLRTLLEVEQFLVQQYNKEGDSDTIKYCLCKKMVMQGIQCTQCSMRMHVYCSVKYLRSVENQGRRASCVKCKKQWDEEMRRKVMKHYNTCNVEAAQPIDLSSTLLNGSQSSRLKRKRPAS